jgi:hypothetical protein
MRLWTRRFHKSCSSLWLSMTRRKKCSCFSKVRMSRKTLLQQKGRKERSRSNKRSSTKNPKWTTTVHLRLRESSPSNCLNKVSKRINQILPARPTSTSTKTTLTMTKPSANGSAKNRWKSPRKDRPLILWLGMSKYFPRYWSSTLPYLKRWTVHSKSKWMRFPRFKTSKGCLFRMNGWNTKNGWWTNLSWSRSLGERKERTKTW